ncbi:HEAT repeat domain-containing protein [Agaribacterium sp. ZY112]|uniref:HEAT repeat domain-containing protein n=1 Tax=Agaribacterium sp. ZY112 TaxID=3233574 RepID=UPI0035265290
MFFSRKNLKNAVLLAPALIVLQACTVTVPLDSPTPSDEAYISVDTDQTITLQFKDSQPQDLENLVGKPVPIVVESNGAPLEEHAYLLEALQKEAKARNLPLNFESSSENKLELDAYQVFHHRVSGFSPLVTVTTARLDLVLPDRTSRIAVAVKRGKVPVMSMGEINEPTFNEPHEILVKEIVAKINMVTFNNKTSDQYVAELVGKIKANIDDRETYLDVYELGFSNNSKALDALMEFSKADQEYIRLSAISGLGMIGGERSFEYLKSIHASDGLWQDRVVALKAIGDIGTEAAINYLKTERPKWKAEDNKESKWTVVVLGLFLDD